MCSFPREGVKTARAAAGRWDMSHGGSVWEEQPAKRLRTIRRARWKAAYRRVTRILEATVTALLLAGVVLVGGLLALAGLALTTLPPAQ